MELDIHYTTTTNFSIAVISIGYLVAKTLNTLVTVADIATKSDTTVRLLAKRPKFVIVQGKTLLLCFPKRSILLQSNLIIPRRMPIETRSIKAISIIANQSHRVS